jgi:tetratricopeptide (TPR) repeat protein
VYLETHLKKIAPQLENFRTALNWGLESDPLAALELAGNMILLWSFGLAKEGLEWITRALDRVNPIPEDSDAETLEPEQARIFTWAFWSRASLLFTLGRNRDALTDSLLALSLGRSLGDPNLISLLNGMIALACVQIGEFETGQRAIEEGLQLAEEHASKFVYGSLLNIKGLIKLSAERDIPRARELLERAVQEDPATARFITGLFPLIKIANLSQDWERSRQLVAMGLQTVEEAYDLDKRRLFNMYNAERGHIERLAGNLDAAEHLYGRLLNSYKELSMEPAVANLLECFAMIALQKGRLPRAARLFGSAEALREQVGADMTMLERMEYGMAVGQLKNIMEAGELDSAWTDGQKLDIDRAIALALEFANPEPAY